MKNIYFLLKFLISYPKNKIKKNLIHRTARFSNNVLISKSMIGMGTYVACNTVIVNSKIGNYCSIAPGVQIGGMQHSYWWLSTSPRLSDHCIYDNKTIIGNDVWIAAGAIIKQGVTIGDGAVVGAMSFVNSNVPENCIYFGSPAKFYKKRLSIDVFNKIKESNYWNYNERKAKKLLLELESEEILE